MSFRKFSDAIKSFRLGASFEKRVSALAEANPDRIYVENVRSIFGGTTELARKVCEEAADDGVLLRKIGVRCANDDRIIASFNSEDELPERIECTLCEIREEDIYEFDTEDLTKEVFYALPDKQ